MGNVIPYPKVAARANALYRDNAAFYAVRAVLEALLADKAACKQVSAADCASIDALLDSVSAITFYVPGEKPLIDSAFADMADLLDRLLQDDELACVVSVDWFNHGIAACEAADAIRARNMETR